MPILRILNFKLSKPNSQSIAAEQKTWLRRFFCVLFVCIFSCQANAASQLNIYQSTLRAQVVADNKGVAFWNPLGFGISTDVSLTKNSFFTFGYQVHFAQALAVLHGPVINFSYFLFGGKTISIQKENLKFLQQFPFACFVSAGPHIRLHDFSPYQANNTSQLVSAINLQKKGMLLGIQTQLSMQKRILQNTDFAVTIGYASGKVPKISSKATYQSVELALGLTMDW